MFVPPAIVEPELRAAPLERLLPELGAKIGRRLEATPATGTVVMVVRRIPGKDPEPLLRAIAKVAYGRWAKGADGIERLVADGPARDKALAAERRARVELWSEILGVRRKRLAERGRPDWRKVAAEWNRKLPTEPPKGNFWGGVTVGEGGRNLVPSSMLMDRVVLSLPPSLLADAPKTGIALSDRPSATQRPLPRAALAAVREWASDQAVWSDERRRFDLAKRAMGSPLPGAGALWAEGQSAGEIGRVVLRLSADPYEPEGVALRLTLFDPGGKTVRMFLERLAEPGDTSEWKKFGPVPRFRFSSDTLAEAAYRKGGDDPRWAAKLREPEKWDPNAGTRTERLIAFAEHRDMPLAAALDDHNGYDRPFADEEPVTIAERWTTFFTEGGVLASRPKSPMRAFAETANRRTLGELVRNGGTGLEARAETAFRFRESPRTSLYREYPRELAERRDSPFRSGQDDLLGEWLAIYGGLRPAQRRSGPEGVPFTALDPGVRELLTRKLRSPFNDLMNATGGRLEGAPAEPTLRWPDADPTGRLFVMEVTDDVVGSSNVPTGGGAFFPGRSGSPEEMMGDIQGGGYAVMDDPAQAPPNKPTLRWGTRRTIRLRWMPDSGSVVEGQTFETEWKSEYGPASALPERIRKRVADHAKNNYVLPATTFRIGGG